MGEMELTSGLRRVARLDLIGGGQVVVDGNYAFVGHMKPPEAPASSTSPDPKNPKLLTTIMLPDNNSHTNKVRVAGDIMVVNVEMNDRHFLRKGEKIQLRAHSWKGSSSVRQRMLKLPPSCTSRRARSRG